MSGLLTKATNVSGKRPVVIALHGTGGSKEESLELLQNLAQLGFIGVVGCAGYAMFRVWRDRHSYRH